MSAQQPDAQVAQAGLASRALSAGGDEGQHHVIAGGDVVNTGANFGDDAGAFMPRAPGSRPSTTVG